MTIAEAIKSKIPYPASTAYLSTILIERGLSGDDEFTFETAKSVSFRGAYADALKGFILFPRSVSEESGVSVSKEDWNVFLKTANSIYGDIGEELIDYSPTVHIVND